MRLDRNRWVYLLLRLKRIKAVRYNAARPAGPNTPDSLPDKGRGLPAQVRKTRNSLTRQVFFTYPPFRKATILYDKVYTLLGMSSDDPNAVAGLSVDYRTLWKDVF